MQASSLNGKVGSRKEGREWMPDEQLFAIAIANLVSQAISQRTRLDVTQ